MSTANTNVRRSIEEFQSWVNQLKAESDLCISEILDAVEPPGGTADHSTEVQASGAIDKIAELIGHAMSAYDSMSESLGRDPYFAPAINHLNELDGNAE